MEKIHVVAGIINRENKVLIARRKQGKSLEGFWEFPGGKIENNESPENALIREFKEEFDIEIRINKLFMDFEFDYENFRVRLISFLIESDNEIKLSIDHDLIEWITPSEYTNYNIAPADIPILIQLCNELLMLS